MKYGKDLTRDEMKKIKAGLFNHDHCLETIKKCEIGDCLQDCINSHRRNRGPGSGYARCTHNCCTQYNSCIGTCPGKISC